MRKDRMEVSEKLSTRYIQRPEILIIGAGVIGSLYAAKMAKAGYSVTVFSRGARLEEIRRFGIRIQHYKEDEIETITKLKVTAELRPEDNYDYVFVALRYDNLASVYPLLNESSAVNIIFMTNNPYGFDDYARHLDRARVLCAFPGAGGEIENGVVKYHIVSRVIQPTTIGDSLGARTRRAGKIAGILRQSGFPATINHDMNSWLLSHLAMVCPLGNIIYRDYEVSDNRTSLVLLSACLKEAFLFLRENGYSINPARFNLFIYTPDRLLRFLLKRLYRSDFAKTVIFNHAVNARQEMALLTEQFIKIAEIKNVRLPLNTELSSFNIASKTGEIHE
ncbi:MAG: ketopantoate reductase family protein [Spirochaetales bacterium]|nr:ketopantoate reductase family protein [Spirochaetales bacterium]